MTLSFADIIDYREIDNLIENQFQIEYSIKVAKENIELYDSTDYCDVEFEKNRWYFYSLKTDHLIRIDFNKIFLLSETVNTQKIIELVNVIKCWVAGLINHLTIETIQASFYHVTTSLIVTQCFNINLINEYKDSLNSLNDSLKGSRISAVINFFEFYNEFEHFNEYYNFLVGIKYPGISVRKIPSANDVFTFSWVLEDFYVNTSKDDWRYTYFYPLKLWWIITMAIPMRIGEFLSISRKGFYKSSDRYVLELKRSKQKNNKKRIQIIDKLEVTKDVYTAMQEYVELTENFGYSDTLISYRAYKRLAQKYTEGSKKERRNPNRITLGNFSTILENFYDNVISNTPYNLSVRKKCEDMEQLILDSRKNGVFFDIERRLRPNDTRHLAFILLMLQGFHPVEIARLGGHTNVYTQRHYHYHEEFMVDSEVIKLIRSFNLTSKRENSRILISNETNIKINKEFRVKNIFKPSITPIEKWDKLEIGYCTALVKDCFSHCFVCEYWKIELEEFNHKRKELEQWINSVDLRLKSAYRALYNIHKYFYQDDKLPLNTEIESNIKKEAILIQDLLESKEILKNKLKEF
jgi:hypothetical protein